MKTFKKNVNKVNTFVNNAPENNSPVDFTKVLKLSVIGSLIFVAGAFLYINYGYVVRDFFYELTIK